MDSNLAQRRQSLEEKIPDIKKTLDMVEYLHERRVSMCLIGLVVQILNDVDRKARERRRERTTKTIWTIWMMKVPRSP